MQKSKHPALLGFSLIILLILAAAVPMELGRSYFENREPGCSLPILMYHCVTDDAEYAKNSGGLYVSAEKFEEDLKYLSENGYRTVLPRDLAEGAEIDEHCVMISFDDGYLDNYEQAFPLLKKYNMSAEINLIVAMIGHPEHDMFMNWDQAREMQASGLVEFGSHTYNCHRSVNEDAYIEDKNIYGVKRLPGESSAEYQSRVVTDIEKSIAVMKEELGVENVYSFAYPYGYSTRFERRRIDKLFTVSFSTKEGTADISRNYKNLSRYHTSEDKPLSEILN